MLTSSEVTRLGFASCGRDVRISADARFFGTEGIHIGDCVRIDAFAIITACPETVEIGSFSHIAACSYLSGAQGGISIGYGCGIAPHSALYSAVEDYTQGHLTNPTIPEDLRATSVGRIILEPHVAVGSSTVLTDSRRCGVGAAIGALSLVSRDVRPFEVVHGNPIRRVGVREEIPLVSRDAALRRVADDRGYQPLPALPLGR